MVFFILFAKICLRNFCSHILIIITREIWNIFLNSAMLYICIVISYPIYCFLMNALYVKDHYELSIIISASLFFFATCVMSGNDRSVLHFADSTICTFRFAYWKAFMLWSLFFFLSLSMGDIRTWKSAYFLKLYN